MSIARIFLGLSLASGAVLAFLCLCVADDAIDRANGVPTRVRVTHVLQGASVALTLALLAAIVLRT